MIANNYDSLISVFATDRRSPNEAPSSTNDLYTLHQKCFQGKDINLIIKNPQNFYFDLTSLDMGGQTSPPPIFKIALKNYFTYFQSD